MADKKFSPMRYTAATEEAAIQGALAVVGVAREDVEYELLDQSAKGITVRIKPRTSDAPVAATPIEVAVEVAEPEVEAAPVEVSPIVEDVPELLAQDDETGEESEEIALETAVSSHVPTEISSETGTTNAVENFIAGGDETPDEVGNFEPVAQAEAEPEAAAPLDPVLIAQAQAKAQEFLDKMGLLATAHLGDSREANTAALIIDGADVGILIGKHGATLQSFQYLLNLTLNSHLEGDGMRVVVDAGNYRARRQSSLEQIARGAASKARRDARSVRLDPMPAHERRLVHMFLQTEADIYTQSEGREPLRRIVISPAAAPQNGTSQNAAPSGNPPRDNAPRDNAERVYSDNRGQHSGMGGFARRNNGGNGGGNRGFNRGR